MMAIISNENETEDIYLLDIAIKETPQKQPHTQPTRSNASLIFVFLVLVFEFLKGI
jgi:hypothetical protein